MGWPRSWGFGKDVVYLKHAFRVKGKMRKMRGIPGGFRLSCGGGRMVMEVLLGFGVEYAWEASVPSTGI